MKKYLVFFGSPRKEGCTSAMLRRFLEQLPGEKIIIDAYRCKDIAPCVDCRHCWQEKSCAISDGMTEIYRQAEACDGIIFAFPVYFHGVPAPLKQIIDRFQVYWAGRVRGDLPQPSGKPGAILLVGGAPLFPNQFFGAEKACTAVLEDLGLHHLGTVTCSGSDKTPPEQQPEVLAQIDALAKRMAEEN